MRDVTNRHITALQPVTSGQCLTQGLPHPQTAATVRLRPVELAQSLVGLCTCDVNQGHDDSKEDIGGWLTEKFCLDQGSHELGASCCMDADSGRDIWKIK
jgi:hypothetical protein